MKLFFALASTTLALGFTSVAAAQDSVSDAYGGQSTDVPAAVVTPPNQGTTAQGTTAPPAGETVAPAAETGAPQSGETVSPVAAEVTEEVAPTVAGATATRPAAAAPAATAPIAAATPTAPETVSSGSLPFTGLDIGLMALGGLLLLGFGFAMRRLTHRSAPLA